MHQNRYVLDAKIISALFFLMYGIVPLLLDFFGIYEVHWAETNFYFSLLAVFFVITVRPQRRFLNLKQFYPKIDLQRWHYITFFFVSLSMFLLFPWHDDRVSLGASFSALMRAVWLIVIFKSIDRSESFRSFLLGMTVLLMFVDESRTYFMIMLMILASRSKYRAIYFVLSITGVIFLAATRMNVSGSFLNGLIYGIVGEAYNATKPVGQILLITNEKVDVIRHVLHTFLQPFVFPVEFVLNRILGSSIPSQFSYFETAVAQNLGQQLSPMGGWYIVADFVHYGAFGLFLMFIYLRLSWWITNYLLSTPNFPFGAFVFFISIKATPYVYYKFIFYIVMVKIIVSLVTRFRVGRFPD